MLCSHSNDCPSLCPIISTCLPVFFVCLLFFVFFFLTSRVLLYTALFLVFYKDSGSFLPPSFFLVSINRICTSFVFLPVFSPAKTFSFLQGPSHRAPTLVCLIVSVPLPGECGLFPWKCHRTLFFAQAIWHSLPCPMSFECLMLNCTPDRQPIQGLHILKHPAISHAGNAINSDVRAQVLQTGLQHQAHVLFRKVTRAAPHQDLQGLAPPSRIWAEIMTRAIPLLSEGDTF